MIDPTLITRRTIGKLMLGLLAAPAMGRAAWAEGLPADLDNDTIRGLIDAAKAAGEAELFTYGMPDDWANYGGMAAELAKMSGAKRSDIDMGSAVVLQRMTEEKAAKNDLADLKPSFARQLAEAGLTADYKVIDWEKIPADQRGTGKDGAVWQAGYKGTLGFIVNTTVVKEVPKSWADLKNPALKGLVSYLDPRSTGTGVTTVLSAALATSGDAYNAKAGVDFLKSLHDAGNIAKVDPTVTTADFERGEVGVLINFDYNLLNWANRYTFGTKVVIPADGTLSSGGGIIAAKNAPHPNLARLFLELMLSQTGQSLLAASFVSPIRPDITLPADIAAKYPAPEAYAKAQFVNYDREAAVSEEVKTLYGATIH
jgi:putative spermidine/putrescine transport system substrate-binding protein